MRNKLKIFSLFIFLWAYIFAGNDIRCLDVQCLIDSGDIKSCFLEDGTLQLAYKGLQSLNGIENVPNAESIKIIDLSHNRIKSLNGSLFKRFSQLNELLLNHNLVEQLTSFDDLTNLRELHLTHNKLKTFDFQEFSKLPMLYVLNLGFNEISRLILKTGASPIGMGDGSSLRSEVASADASTSSQASPFVATPGTAPRARLLKGARPEPVEGCEFQERSAVIKSKEFDSKNLDLRNLEMLFLNNNKIKELPDNAFVACPNLQALYLQNNEIYDLDSNSFNGLFNLKLLYLYDNFITKLPANIFMDLKQLHVLYLRNNAIQSFKKGWDIGLEQLKNIDIFQQVSKSEIDNFLLTVRKEVYQDILVNGITIKEGVKDCEIRYPNIKKILDKYKRPFTVLDIGASEGYFSLRIAAEYDCTCVMIEGDNTLLLPQICKLNKQLNNLIVLQKFITPQDLKELGECEHFDLVLAFNVIHQMKGYWKETIDYLLTLGDHVLIETPPPGCRTAANKEILPLIEEYLSQNKSGKIIGWVPRYGRPGLPSDDQKYSNVYLFEMNKNVLSKPTWGSPNIRFYAINSNFKEKTLYKPRINKTIDWKKGINLWTFKYMNGIYPTRDTICREIKRLSAFSHGDFLPWNMVIQGNNLELIDWEDNNAPGYMHNYEACLAQFETE